MPDPIHATTQDHLDIEDIANNLVITKDGSCALVLKVSAVNFNLLSEQEQDSIIYAYAGLLNSLSFPVQILIRSQKKDISQYVKLLASQEQRQTNPLLKSRIGTYRSFIEQIVKERNVLDKKFYIIIPFQRIELGLSADPPGLPSLKKKPAHLPYDKSYIIQKALTTLEPKRDHLLRQCAHLGLQARQLTTQELIQLFYTIYNPDAGDGITPPTPESLQSPLTQSAHPLAAPNPAPLPTPAQSTPPPTQNTVTPLTNESTPTQSNPPPLPTTTVPIQVLPPTPNPAPPAITPPPSTP